MKKTKNLPRSAGGQSLFELVVAVGLIGLVLVALVGLTTKSLSSSTYSKNKSLAARHTQEALEWLRGLRDQDWTTFFNYDVANGTGTYYCLSALTSPLATRRNCNPNEYVTGTIFVREAYLESLAGSPETVEATVTTRWTDSAGVHLSESKTSFTNWRKK